MSSPEDKVRHSRRIKRKQKEAAKRQGRVRSVIAKELIVSGKFKQRIVKDKRGKEHDLERMTHLQLIEAIQEKDQE